MTARTAHPFAALLRPKGNLSPRTRRTLAIVAALPLVTMVARIMALPGVMSPWFDVEILRAIGSTLNESFSLTGVAPDQRDHVLYLLFLPTCALLVTLARLTFGVRVLGFRSILLAVGLHQSGFWASLLIISVAVGAIVVVRPWLRRIGLPYYARVSVVLCVVAMTMIAALLASPWLRSDVLWSVAYFPVIVLGMLAEGIAHTLDRDNAITAAWRALTTIILAFAMALVCQIPALRALMLGFPEIALTQIVGIVFIAEYMDYRWFQDWDTRAAGVAMPKLVSSAGPYRIAVVRNQPGEAGDRASTRRRAGAHGSRAVRRIVEALQTRGHSVRVLEGDAALLRELQQFIPPNPRTGEPGGLVFNLAPGAQGEDRTLQVPAMLEMAGIAYTGATPLGHALALDRAAAKTLLQQAGIPTPAFRLLSSHRDTVSELQFPLVVRPRHEPAAQARVANDPTHLSRTVKSVIRRYRQEALVEEHVTGRQIQAALLGNDPVECLPLVERTVRGEKICPARIDPALAEQTRQYALAAFAVCDCRDYARVDFRVSDLGTLYVVGVVSSGVLAARGSLACAAEAAGIDFDEVVCRIVELARARYVVASRPRPELVDPQPPIPGDGPPSSAGLGGRPHAHEPAASVLHRSATLRASMKFE